MFMLLFCDFSGEEQIFASYFSAPWLVMINWFLHCLGAFMVFATAGVLAFLYTHCVESVGGFFWVDVVLDRFGSIMVERRSHSFDYYWQI